MKRLTRYRKWLAPVVSLILIIVLAAYTPWDDVGAILGDFDAGTVILLVALSLAYYTLKTVRFWYLMQAVNINHSFKSIALSYMSAQPVSLLPAGEVYRSHSLQKFTGTPVRQSLIQFTVQGLLEGGAMASLMVISALALGTLRIAAIVFLILVVAAAWGLRQGLLGNVLHFINRLPFIKLNDVKIDHFSSRHRSVLSRQWLPLLYGLSILVELVGSAIAYVSVTGLGGEISIYQAVLLYAIPIIVGFLSLLPGGFGVSEQSAVAVLLLSHVSVGQAVASTLIMRVTIVGMGVVYGLVAMAYGQGFLANNKLKTASQNN